MHTFYQFPHAVTHTHTSSPCPKNIVINIYIYILYMNVWGSWAFANMPKIGLVCQPFTQQMGIYLAIYMCVDGFSGCWPTSYFICLCAVRFLTMWQILACHLNELPLCQLSNWHGSKKKNQKSPFITLAYKINTRIWVCQGGLSINRGSTLYFTFCYSFLK